MRARPANPAVRRRERHAAQPGRAGPRPTGTGRPGAPPAGRRARGPQRGGGRRRRRRRTGAAASSAARPGRPSPRASSSRHLAHPAQLRRAARPPGPAGPGRRCARGTPRPGCRARRRRWRARPSRPAPPTPHAGRRPARGCRHDREAAPAPPLDDLVEQRGRRRRTRRGRPSRCRPRRAGRRTTPPRRAVALRRPGRLPGAGGPDQQHQSRVGNLHPGSMACLAASAHPLTKRTTRTRSEAGGRTRQRLLTWAHTLGLTRLRDDREHDPLLLRKEPPCDA